MGGVDAGIQPKVRTSARKLRTLVDGAQKTSEIRAVARWRSGYAEDCKSLHAGSIPARASTHIRKVKSPLLFAMSWRSSARFLSAIRQRRPPIPLPQVRIQADGLCRGIPMHGLRPKLVTCSVDCPGSNVACPETDSNGTA